MENNNILDKKFFITGACGWLGRSLVKNLLNGKFALPVKSQNIITFCLPDEDSYFLSNLGVKVYKGDIRDIQSVKDFLKNAKNSIIIHLCGVIHPRYRISDFFDVNYLGSKHILQIAQQVEVEKVVLMSSNSAVGCNKSNADEDVFTEESAFNPYMKYGESKFLTEKFAQNFTSHYENPKVVVIRAPWFYGPHQPLRQTTLFHMIKNGTFPIIGDGENKRSMVYTENLSQGLILAALSNKSDGQTYWIADSKAYPMNEIIETTRKVMENEFGIKCKKASIRLPSLISELAFVIDKTLQTFGMYQQKIHVLSEMNKNIFCSIKKAENELGYKAEFELYSGMKESIKWCFENKIKI